MISFTGIEINNDRPVYIQLIEYVKIQIHLGTLADGDDLPSRRDLAGMLGINPNTVQKAYKQLEEEKILQTGNNVKSRILVNDEIKSRIAEELTHETVSKFINHAKSLNMSFKDTVDLISKLWH